MYNKNIFKNQSWLSVHLGRPPEEAHPFPRYGCDCDTVGDLLKCTSGPSLNILIKLMAIF